MGGIADGRWPLARLVTTVRQRQGGAAIVNVSTYATFEPEAAFPTSGVFRAGLAVFAKLHADQHVAAGILVVLMLAGLAVGWRVNNGPVKFIFAVMLLLAFAYVMAWIGVWIGLTVSNTETAQQLTFVTIFPLTFISNVFVPPASLPGILQPIAEWNPVSTLTASCRELFGNPNPTIGSAFPSQHPIEVTIAWSIILIAIFAPLAVKRYRATSH